MPAIANPQSAIRNRPRLSERIRRNERISPILAFVLAALTLPWRLGMWFRLRQARVRVQARVISFGNITAGGSGKTPAVIERVRIEMAAGKRVAVLTRGYGTRDCGLRIADCGLGNRKAEDSPDPVPISNPQSAICNPQSEEFGDEPALIARKCPGVVLVKCADRVAGARAAIDEQGCDVLILDDGFQHVRLERDENIVLIDAANPFGNGWLIPRGILREPPQALRRATALMITRGDQAADLPALRAQLESLCPGIPIRTTRHAPKGLWRVADGAPMPLDELRGKEVKAVCGIGHPEAFFRTIEALGARIAARAALADHAPIPDAEFDYPGLVVLTEKDAMRLRSAPPNVAALGVEIEDL